MADADANTDTDTDTDTDANTDTDADTDTDTDAETDTERPSFVEPVEILLVDDDAAWTRGTARLLAHAHDAFRVTTATSLAEGRDQYAEGSFDCVVCDYQLGDGTGLGLLDTVRASEPDRPFILVTGRGDERLASEAIHRDITDYIIKELDDGAALLADSVASAVAASRTERALERERRSKSALLDLLGATADEPTLCGEVCSILVEDHGYACSWIGSKTDAGIVARAAAGAESYVDAAIHDRPQSADGDPALAAVESDEPVVRRLPLANADADADTDTEPPWETLASEYGFESAAGIPIEHEGVRFGVLGVYAAGRPTIDADALDSLSAFVETLGYALHTADFKRSLGSDRSVGVEIEIDDPAAPLVGLERGLPRTPRLVVPSIIHRDDGTTLYLVRAEGVSESDLTAAVDASDRISFAEGQTELGEAEPLQCRLVAADPTPESLLAEQGASPRRTVTENGTTSIRIRLADHRSLSAVAEALRSAYETAVVTSVRQDHGAESLGTVETLLEPLTDKQATTIRHAYHEGFFEHPRDTTATELADQFGLTRQTVTHHLRAAERKFLDRLFDA